MNDRVQRVFSGRGPARALARRTACAFVTRLASGARAWSLPEHRRISLEAVLAILPTSDGPPLCDLWSAIPARVGVRVPVGEALTAPNMSSQALGEVALAGEQTAEGAAVGVAGRVQAPWAFFPFDGILAMPFAAAKPDEKFRLPLTGMVTTDAILDVGPQAIWGDGDSFRLGAFLSLASTTRYFP